MANVERSGGSVECSFLWISYASAVITVAYGRSGVSDETGCFDLFQIVTAETMSVVRYC